MPSDTPKKSSAPRTKKAPAKRTGAKTAAKRSAPKRRVQRRKRAAQPVSAVLEHAAPGRARLRMPQHRRDTALFERMADEIAALDPVIEVRANPVTAGVLIHHAGPFSDIVALAAAGDIFELTVPVPQRPLHEQLFAHVGGINSRVRAATNGEFDLSSALFFMFLATGIAQLARGQIAMPAMSAFWYALNSMISAHNLERGAQGPGDDDQAMT